MRAARLHAEYERGKQHGRDGLRRDPGMYSGMGNWMLPLRWAYEAGHSDGTRLHDALVARLRAEVDQ